LLHLNRWFDDTDLGQLWDNSEFQGGSGSWKIQIFTSLSVSQPDLFSSVPQSR
jgi:hypothetical protein